MPGTARLVSHALALCVLAWADSAQAGATAFAASPLPNREREPARLYLGDSPAAIGRIQLGDERIDVTLQRHELTLDVYPTFVAVRERMWLEAGERGARNVGTGFPERLPAAGGCVVALQVEVDGAPVQAQRDGIWMNAFDLSAREVGGPDAAALRHERLASWGPSVWLTWRMDFERRSRTQLEVQYALALAPTAGDEDEPALRRFTHMLRTASLWKGPVGELEVRLVAHGIEPDALRIESESGIRSQDGDALVWRHDAMEPARDLVIEWRADDARASEGPLPSAYALLDTSVRMLDESDPERWREFVARLLDTRDGTDAHAAALASALLDDLRRALNGLPEQAGAATLAPTLADLDEIELAAAVGRAIAWLGGPLPPRADECAPPQALGGHGPVWLSECEAGLFERAGLPARATALSALVVAADDARTDRRGGLVAIAAGVGGLVVLTLAWTRRRRRRRSAGA